MITTVGPLGTVSFTVIMRPVSPDLSCKGLAMIDLIIYGIGFILLCIIGAALTGKGV